MSAALKWLCSVLFLVGCDSSETKAPEAELRALLYCNQDWGSSPHRINNDGNPRCETPCASFTMLEHHGGCTLVAPSEVSGVTCSGALTAEWEGWRGCCAPHSKDALGNFQGVKFIECD
jgi:hypothetical protein